MILVTGGAGFIGSNLVAALCERATAPVHICDWLDSPGKSRNIAKHPHGEVIAPESLPAWLDRHGAGLEAIFHLGASSSTVEPDAKLVLDNNLDLSMRLWRWCAERSVRFIYASSAATYGDGQAGFDDDNGLAALSRLTPLNLYGWSKHAFDVNIMLWLYDNADVGGIFNVGTGMARGFADLARACFSSLGRAVDITYIDTPEHIRRHYQYHTQAAMDRLRRAGYDRAPTSLEDGVERYIRDYLETNDPHR
jgi:nucleoside-diphosphate-sugar epimerase